MTLRPLVILVVAFALAPLVQAQSVGCYQEFGDARGFRNIVPPGQDGVLNAAEAVQAQGGTYPPHVRDQLDSSTPPPATPSTTCSSHSTTATAAATSARRSRARSTRR